MPELPEVECVRRSLEQGLVGRAITGVRVLRRDVITAPGDPPGGFSRSRGAKWTVPPEPAKLDDRDLLVGARVERVERRGKQLALWGADVKAGAHGQRAVLVHLGMTGQLVLSPKPDHPHTHVVWTLGGQAARAGTLVFRDARRFGGVRLAPDARAVDAIWSLLGPDALTIDHAQLAERLAGSSRAIKATLLDQGVLAGVGNIYADEALWQAQIAPTRAAGRLADSEVGRLASAVRDVLARAIEAGGSTLRDYVDGDGNPGSYQARHSVYGRGGLACLRCGKKLASETIAQRTTVWCRGCQRGDQLS